MFAYLTRESIICRSSLTSNSGNILSLLLNELPILRGFALFSREEPSLFTASHYSESPYQMRSLKHIDTRDLICCKIVIKFPISVLPSCRYSYFDPQSHYSGQKKLIEGNLETLKNFLEEKRLNSEVICGLEISEEFIKYAVIPGLALLVKDLNTGLSDYKEIFFQGENFRIDHESSQEYANPSYLKQISVLSSASGASPGEFK